MKWQSPPMQKTELRKGAPLMVPRTGTRPRAPKVFSTSKGRLMEQTSPPSLRLTTARKRLTGDFACEDFNAAPFILDAASFVVLFFVATFLASRFISPFQGLVP